MPKGFLLLLTVAASPLAAQSPLVGSWQISFPGEVRVVNGETTVIPATGVLTLVTQADSLIGTLVPDPTPDRPNRPALRLAGVAEAGKATLISRSTATLRMNGDSREATVLSTWVLGANGDSLEGTLERRLEGMSGPGQGPSPVTGQRKQG